MEEQAELYQEMSAILQELAATGDIDNGAQKLTPLVSKFQESRARLAALPKPSEEEQLRLADLPVLAAGHEAFFEAQSAFFSSEHKSPRISNILSGLHVSKPVAGEGQPQ